MNNINLLQKLCLSDGISGAEHNIRNFIISEISSHVNECNVDKLGNIIAFKKGKQTPKNKIMMCAHMDEVGLIVTHVTSDGYLGFTTVGGVDVKILHGISVKVGKNQIRGVIGVKPVHLVSADERSKPAKLDSLLIDIGANSKEEALKHINIGDMVTFDSIFVESETSIISKAIDDRAGCCILIDIIKSELEFDTYFVFTVQEETGLTGAKVATFNVNPDVAIVIESTTASDIPSVDDAKQICKLGKGATLSFMDKSTIYDKDLYQLCIATANENNIPVQIKQGVTGGNDSGAIHCSREGVRTLAISIPCRYLHSQASVIYKSDYEAVNQLARVIISKINCM